MAGESTFADRSLEQAVLGALIAAGDSGENRFSDLWLELQPKWFFYKDTRRVAERALYLLDNNILPDSLTLGAEIPDLTTILGESWLCGAVFDVSEIRGRIFLLEELWHKRKLNNALLEASEGLAKGLPLTEVHECLERALQRALQRVLGGNKEQSATLAEAYQEVEKYQTGEIMPSLEFGIERLDRFAPAADEFVVIGARPSMGKTAFAVALAERLAARDKAVLFLSLEMSARAIQIRRLAAASRIPFDRLRRKFELQPAEWKTLAEQAALLDRRPVHVVHAGYTPRTAIGAVRRFAKTSKLDAVIIDHLQLIQYPRSDKYHHEIGLFTQQLALLAKELKVAIFAISQLSRATEARSEKLPSLSDLRESGRIEEDADLVYMLLRPEYYEPDNLEKRNLMLVNVAKNRNGPTGIVKLYFEKQTGFFSEWVE